MLLKLVTISSMTPPVEAMLDVEGRIRVTKNLMEKTIILILPDKKIKVYYHAR